MATTESRSIQGVAHASMRFAHGRRDGGPLCRAWWFGLPCIVAWCLFGPGCAGPSKSTVLSPANESGLSPADLQKAQTPLANLEPSVDRPATPNDLPPLSERSVRQIAAAKTLMDEQRYTEAALELEKALRYDPNHPEVHRALAQLHAAAGNAPRARQHAQQAIRANPNDAVAQYLVGRGRLQDGDVPGALAALRAARLCTDFEQQPATAALTAYYLAEALRRDGYLVAALEQYAEFETRARQLPAPSSTSEAAMLWQRGHGPVCDAKADVLEALGRLHEAADALVIPPSGDPARIKRRTDLLVRAGKYDEALRTVRTLDPADPDLLRLTMDIHRRAGHPERAVDELRALLEQPDADPAAVLLLADLLSELRRADEIAPRLRRHLEAHPEAHRVRDRLLDVLISQRAWIEAVRVAADGLMHTPESSADIERRILTLAAEPAALDAVLKDSRSADPRYDYLCGLLSHKTGRVVDAERWFRKSLEGDARLVPARAALAGLYLDQYRYDEALTVARRRDPHVVEDVRLELVLGEIHDRLDDIRQSEAHYRAALDVDRANENALFALARLARRAGDLLHAQQHLQTLLRLNPKHEQAREAMAFLYLDRHEFEAAVREIEELTRVAATPTTRARARAIIAQTRGVDFAAYREDLLRAMRESRPDAATWIALAETYIGMDEDKAREGFAEALKLEPGHEEALLGLKDAERRLLRFEESVGRLNDLLRRRPNRHVWRLELIDLLVALGESDQAIAQCKAQCDRSEVDARVLRAYRSKWMEILIDTGRKNQAVETLTQWKASGPEATLWTVQLARVLESMDRSAEAAELYQAVLNDDPDHPTAWRDYIFACADAGLVSRASQKVLDRLNDDPENDGLLSLLIRVLRSAKQYDDAIELIRNRLLRTPERESFQDFWIGVHVDAERHDRAAELIEKLLDEAIDTANRLDQAAPRESARSVEPSKRMLQPNSPASLETLQVRVHRLRQNLAALLSESNRFRDAERMLLQWLDQARDPRSRLDYLTLLSALHQRAGNEEQAQEAAERALALDPDSIGLNNDVAYGWINRGVRLDEAERMIRVALARETRSAAFLDTYGWLLYKRGRFAEAAVWISRAVANMAAPDAVLHDHLGDVYWRLDRRADAEKEWTRAVELVNAKKEKDIASADERRVRQLTPEKREAARAGKTPAVAAIARE